MNPYFEEGCRWLGGETCLHCPSCRPVRRADAPALSHAESGVDAAFLVTHWNEEGLGCAANMTASKVWEEIKGYPGCAELAAKKLLM